MTKKKLGIIEYKAFNSLLHSCEQYSIVILWGLLYLSVFIFLSFGCLKIGESEECYGLSFLEKDLIKWGIHYPLDQSYQTCYFPGIFALILFFEYRRGHIWEKEPPDRKSDLNNATFMKMFRRRYCMRRLFIFMQYGDSREFPIVVLASTRR